METQHIISSGHDELQSCERAYGCWVHSSKCGVFKH